jgi:hypothetical protein
MVRNLYRSVWISFAVAAFIAVAPLATAQESGFSASDRATIRAYALTPGKLTAYIEATSALAAAAKANRMLAAEVEQVETSQTESLAESRAAFASHPRVFAFYQRQGLTVDDTVLIPNVFGFATAQIQLNNPTVFSQTVSPAQVDFFRSNTSLIERLAEASVELQEATEDGQ